MNEVKVTSWNELQDFLFEDWFNPKIGRYRAPHAFRGLSDSSYRLSTTLMRLGGPYTKLEPHSLLQTSKNSIEMGLFGWWISKKRLSSYRKFSKTKLNELIRQCFR
ncbi:MAG: hypothetical protein ACTSRC_12030 [Candidatus Helarchaeota archaeon]